MRILTASCKMASILFTFSLIPSSLGVFVEVIVCCKSVIDEVNSFATLSLSSAISYLTVALRRSDIWLARCWANVILEGILLWTRLSWASSCFTKARNEAVSSPEKLWADADWSKVYATSSMEAIPKNNNNLTEILQSYNDKFSISIKSLYYLCWIKPLNLI